MGPTTRRGLLVGDIFRDAARATPGRVAAVVGDGALTFADVQERAAQVRRSIDRAGVGHGDRVVVWADTALDLVPLFAGAAQAGVVFVPISPLLGTTEAAVLIAAARPSLVVADEARAAEAQEIAARLGVVARHLGPLVSAEVLAVGDVPPDSAIDEDDPHVVFFTSGSTGRPKGVVLSHRVNVLRSHPGAQFERRGVAVCPFPLFHMAAWTVALGQWHARDTVVFVDATAPAIASAVTRHRATRLNAVPAVWRRLLDLVATGDGGAIDLTSLRFADTGTSATAPALLEAMQAALPAADVRVFYGSTEAGNVATLEHEDLRRKPGRVGVPSVSTELRLDEHGELLVRSPLLADGYFDDDEATARAFAAGWYRTGDLAEMDEDGYLAIVGRAHDGIRTGGETVIPAEVERVLAEHPAVADVAVVGRPDADWGEVVCAVVVVADEHEPPSLDDLHAHAAASLARYKHPRALVVVEQIPRTAATGQVERRLLDDLVRAMVS